MARKGWIDTYHRFLAADLAKQLPGSFENTAHYLFEHDVDLGSFAARYRGDRQGLIGCARFSINGIKRPANASKATSGTQADFQRYQGISRKSSASPP